MDSLLLRSESGDAWPPDCQAWNIGILEALHLAGREAFCCTVSCMFAGSAGVFLDSIPFGVSGKERVRA